MPAKEKYLDEVRDVLDDLQCEHATRFEHEYCFDSIVDHGSARIALKVSITIDNVDIQSREELTRICPYLRCTPLIIGERTRKTRLQDGVVHTRGTIPAINLETLRRLLEDEDFPFILAKKGGIYVMVNGDRIKETREALNYSRGDVAEEIGLSRRAVYEYERGTMTPTINIALQLEKMLDTQIVKPLNILEMVTERSNIDPPRKPIGRVASLATKVLEVLSRLGLNSTITQDTPFDILTSLRQQVVLSCLRQRLEHLEENRLLFLAQLADVLREHPVVITSERISDETIQGIPVISLEELLSIESPKEFVALIRNRRGA